MLTVPGLEKRLEIALADVVIAFSMSDASGALTIDGANAVTMVSAVAGIGARTIKLATIPKTLGTANRRIGSAHNWRASPRVAAIRSRIALWFNSTVQRNRRKHCAPQC